MAFIELHVEQGPVLESEKIDLGFVDFIVKSNEIRIRLEGRADHAGTTPMGMRKDALLTAAKIIKLAEESAFEAGQGTVATVGELEVKPGAANIVPGEVELTVDIRSKYEELVSKVKADIISLLKEEEKNKGISWEINELLDVGSVNLSEKILAHLKDSAEECNFSYKIMSSGAGHDSMIMAELTEAALIFVPSRGGRSHCPEEWTDYADLQKGVEVIYQTVKKISREDYLIKI